MSILLNAINSFVLVSSVHILYSPKLSLNTTILTNRSVSYAQNPIDSLVFIFVFSKLFSSFFAAFICGLYVSTV